MKRVAIYGGTFNPPTKAHKMVVEHALQQVDEVWVMPNASPFKKGVEDWADRYIMCEKMFAKNNRVIVSSFEREVCHLTRGYTVPMMELLISKHYKVDDMDIYFIIGEDNAETIMNKWHRGKDAINMFKFITIPRINSTGTQYAAGYDWYKKDPHIYLSDIQPSNLSSTMLRNELAIFWNTKENSQEELESYRRLIAISDAPILQYIFSHGIYGGNGWHRKSPTHRIAEGAF